jgi:hypothetical protein
MSLRPSNALRISCGRSCRAPTAYVHYPRKEVGAREGADSTAPVRCMRLILPSGMVRTLWY